MRILHVTAELVFGGVENWLLSILPLLSTRGLHMDLAVTGAIDSRVQTKFERLGARVFPCPSTYRPLHIIRNLRNILRAHGPYDILHCHVHRGNAHAALAGRLSGMPAIVVHSHLDCLAEEAGGGWRARSKQWVAAALQRAFADKGLACSPAAGDFLFGGGAGRYWSVHYCGIDLARFEDTVDRLAMRRRMNVPANAFVVGHIGRFEPVKNYALLFDVAARYTASNDDALFVLVGDGPLLPMLQQRADQVMPERMRFLGARDDVPELLLGVFDAFLLPSLAEGLPISLLEAQAAGLPALISDRIPAEARVLPEIEILRIGQPSEDWCAALDRLRGRRVNAETALARMREAGFGVEESALGLERQYRNLLRASGRSGSIEAANQAEQPVEHGRSDELR